MNIWRDIGLELSVGLYLLGKDPDLAWIKVIDDAILAALCAAFLKKSRRDFLQANRL